jgi:hypothetical protein
VATTPPARARGSASNGTARIAHVEAEGADVVVVATTPTQAARTSVPKLFLDDSDQTKSAIIAPHNAREAVAINRRTFKSETDSVRKIKAV